MSLPKTLHVTPHVLVEQTDAILKLTMNRPEKKNALTQDMYGALADAIEGAQGDTSVRVIYLTGTADSFTAGNDLADFAGAKPQDTGGNAVPNVTRYLQAILASEKPLVAAVNGLAVGVGVTMLLHCDLVYAARSATFQTPFVNLALVPEAGSSLLLPALIGNQKAADMFLLGTKIRAEEADTMGLVAGVFDDSALQDEAWSRAQALAAKAPSAVMLTKSLMRKNRDLVGAQMREEGGHFAAQLQTPEFAEAAAAFAERRAPDFSKIA